VKWMKCEICEGVVEGVLFVEGEVLTEEETDTDGVLEGETEFEDDTECVLLLDGVTEMVGVIE